jgi:hypothetical protein
MSNGHGEKGIGLLTNWVGMGQSGILLGPLSYLSKIIIDTEDAQWADPHHGPVGLAVGIGPAAQPRGDGRAAVERTRVQPKDIGLKSFLGFLCTLINQHPGQHQRHLGIIGWLPGNRMPVTAICKLTNTIWVLSPYCFRTTELHQAA